MRSNAACATASARDCVLAVNGSAPGVGQPCDAATGTDAPCATTAGAPHDARSASAAQIVRAPTIAVARCHGLLAATRRATPLPGAAGAVAMAMGGFAATGAGGWSAERAPGRTRPGCAPSAPRNSAQRNSARLARRK